MKLYIISNRLPVKAVHRDGAYLFTRSEGGLATGLHALHTRYEKHWIGWPGVDVETDEDRRSIREELAKMNFHPIFLTPEQIANYYEGYSNSTIWPLCHYFFAFTRYRKDFWEAYRKVNALFCEEILRRIEPDDIVWVQDYQLMLLPGLLREHRPALPMGIDYAAFHGISSNAGAQPLIAKTREQFGDRKLILSVDRLDYSKGILHRLRGFGSFLERYPEYRGQATLAMVIVPSRDRVNSYADLKTEIDKEIGAINGRYSTMEWTPVRYFYHGFSFEELAAMYYVADVALVTPLRDGMNLVAKEYVAVKNDNPGVLILSEMAGAAVELADALPINPNDTEQIAAAIHRALTMPVEEQLRRIERMQAVVSTQTVNKWAADFMKELADVCRHNEAVRRKRLTSETVAAEIVGPYRRAKRRLLLFDYDGTLAPIRSRPEEAVPSHRLCELLRTLGTDAANRVVICSGRDSGTLEKWFGGLPVSLAAEHGAFYKDRGAWRCNIRPASWDPKLSALLEHFARKTPRSRIERKQTALAWHYREADSWLGQLRAQQLVNALMPLCARLNLHILQGDKVVEIKSPRFTKGSETLRLLRQERYDFILALGDDTTDDDMFAALPPRALSIKIGNASEHARYNMPEQSEVVPLLELLARDRGSFDPAGVKHAIRTTWNNLKKLVAGRRTEEYGQ